MPVDSARWQRPLAFAGAWFLALLGIGATLVIGRFDGLVDVNAYWLTGHGPIYSPDYVLWSRGYSYPPPFAQLFTPITWVPWEVVRVVWLVAAVAAYGWLLVPLRMAIRIPLVIALVIWASDNLYWPLALVAVLGLRYPALWALPLLTKITPGVGVLWFAFRREWRSLAIAVGTAAVIAAISCVAAPDLWSTWLTLMRGQDLGGTSVTNFLVPVPPLPVRGLAALVVIWWGARTDRAWSIPVAMFLAQPDIAFATFGLFAAIPRLRGAVPQGTDVIDRWPRFSQPQAPGAGGSIPAADDRP